MNEGMYQAIIGELREISSNVRQLVDLMVAQEERRLYTKTETDEYIEIGDGMVVARLPKFPRRDTSTTPPVEAEMVTHDGEVFKVREGEATGQHTTAPTTVTQKPVNVTKTGRVKHGN